MKVKLFGNSPKYIHIDLHKINIFIDANKTKTTIYFPHLYTWPAYFARLHTYVILNTYSEI